MNLNLVLARGIMHFKQVPQVVFRHIQFENLYCVPGLSEHFISTENLHLCDYFN